MMTTTLEEAERTAYVSPTVENLQAYIAALEGELEDMGDLRKELETSNDTISGLNRALSVATDKIIEYENALGID